jgi:hypothetical protein
LATGPIYEGDSDYWRTLKGDFERIRAYFAEMGLTLVIDELGGYAYLRQAAKDAEEGWTDDGFAPLPRILRRTPLSYHQTIFLVLLRERLLRHEQSTETDSPLYLDLTEITEMLRPYYPELNNEKKLYDAVLAIVRRFDALNLLASMKNRSEPIYRVEPIIKAKLPPELIEEIRQRLGADSNSSSEPEDNSDFNGSHDNDAAGHS